MLTCSSWAFPDLPRVMRSARSKQHPTDAHRNHKPGIVASPLRIAEDDTLRSRTVRQIIHEHEPNELPFSPAVIPKVIIQFWHDRNAVPADVQECLDSWAPLEGRGFGRILFDDYEARLFISKHFGRRYVRAFDRCHHPAMRCDYFRLCYILKYGGFYVDADEVFQGGACQYLFRDNRLKIQPLCYDTSTADMVPSDIFTNKRNDSPHWIFYVNNNPLVAPPFHPVIKSALTRSTRLLLSHNEPLRDIQSTTGPGNLTISLVNHAVASHLAGKERDFVLVTNWETLSVSQWPLSYRNDERNWRLWDPKNANTFL